MTLISKIYNRIYGHIDESEFKFSLKFFEKYAPKWEKVIEQAFNEAREKVLSEY